MRRGVLAWYRRSFAAAGSLLLVAALAAMGSPRAAATGDPLVRASTMSPAAVPAGSINLGKVPGSKRLDLSVILTPSNPHQLTTLLKNLYTSSSAQYHQWLKPGLFLQRFGPTRREVSAVESWLHGAGLANTSVAGFAVKVSARASQVSAAFGVSFKQVRLSSGHVGYLAQRAPLVPRSLATGQITAILGLDTLYPSPFALCAAGRRRPWTITQPLRGPRSIE